MNFDSKDLATLVTIIGCFILMAFGKDSVVTSVLLTVTGYMFGQHANKKAARRI